MREAEGSGGEGRGCVGKSLTEEGRGRGKQDMSERAGGASKWRVLGGEQKGRTFYVRNGGERASERRVWAGKRKGEGEKARV